MKRKIAKIGPSTLMVSLPKKWAKQLNLHKGEEIEVTENGRQLIINAKTEKSYNKLEIHIKDAEYFLSRILTRPYIAGYDELYITFENPAVLTKINEALAQSFLGFVTVEQGPRHCVIKNIAEEYEEDLDRFINKIYMSVITFAKESFEIIKAGDYQKLDGLSTVFEITVKFGYLCLRILNKRGYADKQGISSYYSITSTYSIIRSLAHMNFELKSICMELVGVKQNIRLKPETLKIYQQIVELIEHSYALYKNKSCLEAFYKYKCRVQSLKEPIKNILRKGGFPDAIITSRLLILRDYLYPLARYAYFPEAISAKIK